MVELRKRGSIIKRIRSNLKGRRRRKKKRKTTTTKKTKEESKVKLRI